MGNCQPEKTNVDRGEADIGYYIILNVNLKIHCLHYVWFQNNPGQVNIRVFITYSGIRRQLESMVNHTRLNYANFWNTTRRQAISPVAKFHHVLGSDFIFSA